METENRKQNAKTKQALLLAAVVICACAICLAVFCLASKRTDAREVKLLILPHFENGEMAGDFPGEAQLFYEAYFDGASQSYDIDGGYTLYYNPKNKIAMCVTGSGKANTTVCLTSLLCDEDFDLSNAYILTLGCAGGAVEYTNLGDVCLVTGAYDFDVGYTCDPRELTEEGSTWFYDATFDGTGGRSLNLELVQELYEQVKDTELETTEISKKIMSESFGAASWAVREPQVILGSAITSDSYWKGTYSHGKAAEICEYYGAEYPYAISEMEDTPTAIAADKLGMLDRLVILRVSVNTDVFMNGDTPETLWGGGEKFSEKIEEANSETLDIFEPAMRNLFKVGQQVIEILVAKA